MTRLFLRLWAKLFASLLLAALVALFVVAPRVEKRVGANIGRVLQPVLQTMNAAIVEERQRGEDLQTILDRVSDRFDITVGVIPRTEVRGLDEARTADLDAGHVVARGDFEAPAAYARLEGTVQVLTFTLRGPAHPFGEGRGLGLALLLVAGMSLGVGLIAWPLARRLSRLSRAVESLGAGDLATRAEVGPADAVGRLEATFNAMAAEIQRLVGAHGELLRTVSHELRTPIQRLHLALEMATQTAHAAERERRLARMATDLEELDGLIEELLMYSRLERRFALDKQPVAVADLLLDTKDALAELRGDVSVVVASDLDDALSMRAEPLLARRALENLVQNAMRHARRRVELRAEVASGQVRIDVDDDGPGVPEAERERVFAPFERLRNSPEGARRGHGLGLAIVRRIAESHEGRVEVSASPLGGARFQLWLPAAG